MQTHILGLFSFFLKTHTLNRIGMGGYAMDKKRERQFRELGLTIAYYRKLKRMTQLQLAEAADVAAAPPRNVFR